ncbi:MAG: CoA pyrophosphatase [Rhizobiales bacterium]|nr:CoA pyrophosphatase [Hyphomicrobiales bacterium]
MKPAASATGISPPHEFFDRARARLNLDVPAALNDPAAPATRGDLDLDPSMWERAGAAATRPAAVLVPVVDRPEPGILLTQRTTELPNHAGQIAFPGGKIDEGDNGPLEAALREAKEETGLDRRFVQPIGYLDLYLTLSGFRVLPLVARVDPSYVLALYAREVTDAFEVPLSFLMAPENHQRHARDDWRGLGFRREYYAMPFGERYIWGVTAGILRNLYERIYRG